MAGKKANISWISIGISANSGKLEDGLKKAEKKIKGFGSKTTNLFKGTGRRFQLDNLLEAGEKGNKWLLIGTSIAGAALAMRGLVRLTERLITAFRNIDVKKLFASGKLSLFEAQNILIGQQALQRVADTLEHIALTLAADIGPKIAAFIDTFIELQKETKGWGGWLKDAAKGLPAIIPGTGGLARAFSTIEKGFGPMYRKNLAAAEAAARKLKIPGAAALAYAGSGAVIRGSAAAFSAVQQGRFANQQLDVARDQLGVQRRMLDVMQRAPVLMAVHGLGR